MAGRAREEVIERRLRALASLCGALLGGAALCTALVVVLATRAGGDLASARPGSLPFLLALGAMLVVLLSSAARTAVLRRAEEREEDGCAEERKEDSRAEEREEDGRAEERGDAGLAGEPGEGRLTGEPGERSFTGEGGEGSRAEVRGEDGLAEREERRLAAYVRATRVVFGMLAAASAAGLVAALAGDVPLYGLMVCVTSALVMAGRWPRRVVADRFLESGQAVERRGGR